jgi:hypothetical protein
MRPALEETILHCLKFQRSRRNRSSPRGLSAGKIAPARLRRDIKIAPWHKVTSAAPLECGHSDSTGQGLYNLALSLARAESVRTLLKQRDVDPGPARRAQRRNTRAARTREDGSRPFH